MTTTWPLRARTTESDSRTVLRARGNCWLWPETVMFLFWSVTSLTLGWMCRMTSPSSLICGVTSSAMPEKNGVSVMSGEVVLGKQSARAAQGGDHLFSQFTPVKLVGAASGYPLQGAGQTGID